MAIFSALTHPSASYSRRWFFSGLASAAVLVLGVFITVQTSWQGNPESPANLPADTFGETATTAPVSQRAEAGGPASGSTAESVRAADTEVASAVTQNSSGEAPSRAMQSQSGNVLAKRKQEAMVANYQHRQVMSEATTAQRERQARYDGGWGAAVPAAATEPMPDQAYRETGRDRFASVTANPIKRVGEEPVSTFSIDVDTAAYSFVRRQLNQGVLPQKAAVRVEEMINYFPYDYPAPADSGEPFSTSIAVLDSPWKAGNKLLRIGIQGYQLQGEQPRSNLVFLLDVSGSMNSPDKLPLVKQSMGLLLSRLRPQDTVAIVVYAGAAGTVLEPTPVKDRQKILDALARVQAGGSTAGADGIQLAYQVAASGFVKDGVNRVILATDGDFNVGIDNREELQGLVERKRESGIYLSVLGFGQGNYHDALMQALAQNGNGIAAYIDTLGEAQKTLVHEATSALFPIAKDVKIQVEFNPGTVSEYRLLGYETRLLAGEDFNNDAVDAGDIGAGHSVTALYEITPTGSDSGVYTPSRYGAGTTNSNTGQHDREHEYGFVKLRYKLPAEGQSHRLSLPIVIGDSANAKEQREARFAAAVAGFAELLRGGKYTGDWRYADALALAQANRGDDPYGYRAELVQLIRKAEVASAL
ncbi:MAG: vWA domain-containing protein [Parahaliea sp.]